MYTADLSGRLHPVGSASLLGGGGSGGAHALDRHALAAMGDDAAMAARVADSGAARLSPHVHAWARHSHAATSGEQDE